MILRTRIIRWLDENRTKSVRELADFYPKFGQGFNAGNPMQSHGQGWRREAHFGQGTRYPLKGQGVLCFAPVARNASRDVAPSVASHVALAASLDANQRAS
jgi:hypothetical protein